jgi:large subunit ribosomal protein L20
MHSLKKLGINLDRKTLADLAYNDKEVFAALVEKTKLAA